MQVHRVYADLETTGLDPEYHSIIEVGAVSLDAKGNEVSSYQSLCNPGDWAMKNSQPEAFEVNGIDPDEVRAARPIEDVAREFLAYLNNGATLHAFPVSFERGFLERAPWSLEVARWGDCIQEAARTVLGAAGVLRYIRGRPKRPKLSEAAAFFNIKQSRAHRALEDARTTAQVHVALMAPPDPVMDEVQKLTEDGM